MTKKEQKHVEELTRRLRIMGALRWTGTVEPDMPIPGSHDGVVNGYLFNAYGVEVAKACSDWGYHAFRQWDKTTSQQPRKLYSTYLLALKGLRNAVERECADKLAKIDLAIEKESEVA